jgi:hypothetical protein
MYPRLHCFLDLSIALGVCLTAALTAPAQTSAPAGTTAAVRGHISDPAGAMIAGAKIAITTSAGTAVITTTSDGTGGYVVSGLAPGGYIVQVNYEGFAPFASAAISLAAGQVKRVDISMSIESEQQSVVVTDESPTVNTEAGGNASAVILKDKDLDALSDDPDELASELTALAGPSAGPNGGQIYIDGFTGGQLPPKSAIREIRINQNPFSAEYDKLGYGRIEVLTKPGTDKLHGRFFVQGNDDIFNTGNPFTTVLPSYHSYQINGTLNGSLSRKASFFISAEQRNNQNDSVYSLAQAPVLDSATNTYLVGSLTGGLFSPQTHTNIAPRIDLQLGAKNTLTLRYQFYRNSQSGQVGSTSLPSQAYTLTSIENTVQLSDSQILNNHMVNETRFQYLRDGSSTTPASSAPLIMVPGTFMGGGDSGQFSHDHQDHLELQNLTTISMGAQGIKFGMRLRDNRAANSTDQNFNGSFTFNDVTELVSALNGTGGRATKLTYTTGVEGARANLFDAALFVQDDWKFNRFLTVSGGLRWESQNHISDHNDWAPRVAFAYALDGHQDKKLAKTVLRGGFGLFYDRLLVNYLLFAERFNGGAKSQTQTTWSDPICFNATSLSAIVANSSVCGTSASSTSTIVQVAPNFHAPYTEQTGASLERQVTKTITLTATYLHSFGVHQLTTRNANAFEPGTFEYGSTTLTGVRPYPTLGLLNQYYPESVFKQNQLIVNINAKFSPNFGVTGFYNLTSAHSDGGVGSNASNSYNLSQDYGRASFASRNMLFLMGSYTGPWGITFNPFMMAQSGKPFNIVTPYDLTGDNFFNDRPAYASAASIAGNVVHTSYGDFDTIPQSGETIIPANLGNGPAAVAVNLRISRAFGFGSKLEAAASQDNGVPPQGGRSGGSGGRGGGGIGPGGMSGGLGGVGSRSGISNSASTGRRYSLSFSVQALNLFNDIDYGTPVGNVIAPNFDKSTSLAGGLFSSGAAARRIFFQTVFSF